MNWTAFIFSATPANTRKRHGLFWFIYSIAFTTQSISPILYSDFFGKALYVQAVISLICYLPVCIFSVYTFHYILLVPLQKNRFAGFILKFFLLLMSIYILSLIATCIFSIWICSCPLATISSRRLFGLTFINASHALVIGMIILGFSFTKKWISDQKEIKNLKKQKIQNELETLKANIYPDFLLQSLTSIRKKVREDRSGHSKMLIKLSDVLSYILYECKQETVPLKREISMISSLIDIEKVNKSGALTISFTCEGALEAFSIKSLMLFPVLHYYFSSLVTEGQEPFHCQIEILLKTDCLCMQLLTSTQIPSDPRLLESSISRLKERLNHSQSENLWSENTGDKNQSIITLTIPLIVRRRDGLEETGPLALQYT